MTDEAADRDVVEQGDRGTAEERLRDLEVAEDRYEAGLRLDRRFELWEAILLSLAALLAAWAGFQAAEWSGVHDAAIDRASAARTEAAVSSDRSNAEQVADLILFTDWLAAAENEGLLSATTLPDEPGEEPDPTLLSGFLYQRFRPEFREAVDAWVATSPRTNPDAPPSPFAMPEYSLDSEQHEAGYREKEARAEQAARTANSRADNYVLMTILLASVLFFAGISSKMDTAKARVLLLSIGASLLVVCGVVVIALPKAF